MLVCSFPFRSNSIGITKTCCSERNFRPSGFWRRRLVGHLTFWGLLWPAFSVLMAAVNLREQSVTAGIPFGFALSGTLGGALRMVPDIFACSLLLAAFSATAFSLIDWASELKLVSYWIECVTTLTALWLGAAFEFPILLHHPLLRLLRSQTVSAAYAILIAVLLSMSLVAASPKKQRWKVVKHLGVAVGIAILGWAWTFVPVRGVRGVAGSNRLVIVGLDSMSQADDLTALRRFTKENDGTFFEKAVTPGLMTNSVWPAIAMHRMPNTTGVLLIYQVAEWERSPFHLVHEAKRRGYQTWSFFGDQFTCYLGSDGSFDHDESGPVGWLQLATSQVKEGSVLVPLLLSRLPRIPYAGTPRNQAGTYAHDLRAELEAMLAAGDDRPTLIVGHVDYLHLPSYPRTSELSGKERSVLLGARVSSIQDLSLDWQYPDLHDDRINLYQWKLQHLQKALIEAVDRTHILDASKKNRVVVFSDHGNRRGVTRSDFGQPQYYNVLLSTFGVPARDPERPISLLEIPSLLGLEDESNRGIFDPAVEYTNLETNEEWETPLRKAEFKWDGRVILPRETIDSVRRALKGFRPYSDPAGYYDPGQQEHLSQIPLSRQAADAKQ